jgi:hypothetical protein
MVSINVLPFVLCVGLPNVMPGQPPHAQPAVGCTGQLFRRDVVLSFPMLSLLTPLDNGKSRSGSHASCNETLNEVARQQSNPAE